MESSRSRIRRAAKGGKTVSLRQRCRLEEDRSVRPPASGSRSTSPKMWPSERDHPSRRKPLRLGNEVVPALRTVGLAAVVFLAPTGAAPSRAQQAAPTTSGQGATPVQEDSRAIRTREFLGLGRMPDAKMAAEGSKIFGPNCSFCHGADARGGTGPDLLRSAVVLDDNQGEAQWSTRCFSGNEKESS